MGNSKYEVGLKIKEEIFGKKSIEKTMAEQDDFSRPYQELSTEYCWGTIWARPGLSRKIRSLLNLAMLTALNRSQQLESHIQGALTNGCTKEEICEVFLQTAIYCGIPAANTSFGIAKNVFAKLEKGPQE